MSNSDNGCPTPCAMPEAEHSTPYSESATRRDFMVLSASAIGVVGAASMAWPFINSMNPSADVLALSSVEVDLSPIKLGQGLKVKWRGKPVFIRHRTQAEIDAANKVDVASLRDPQKDSDRVKAGHAEWLVVIDVCTHLGCIPLAYQGEFDGWFCPCHGSQYDTSGRIRKGPAPLNLFIPDYTFLSDTKIRIG